MPAFRIEGYVIVSADGMLANADRVMPDELKFEGDKQFFTAALDRADLIVHGRNSGEGQPNSPRRKRLIVTRRVAALGPDPANPKATFWNPAGSSFQQEHDEDDGAVWLQERNPRDLTRPFPAETYRNVRYLAAFEPFALSFINDRRVMRIWPMKTHSAPPAPPREDAGRRCGRFMVSVVSVSLRSSTWDR